MNQTKQNQFLEKIRSNLGRSKSSEIPPVPQPRPSRELGKIEDEVEILIDEINTLSGEAKNISKNDIKSTLGSLVDAESIKKAVLWDTPFINKFGFMNILEELGVEIIPSNSDKFALAECDLGITKVDFAIPYTGTVCLWASPQKPAAVSLLPRIH